MFFVMIIIIQYSNNMKQLSQEIILQKDSNDDEIKLFSSPQTQNWLKNSQYCTEELKQYYEFSVHQKLDTNKKFGYFIQNENTFVECTYFEYLLIEKYLTHQLHDGSSIDQNILESE